MSTNLNASEHRTVTFLTPNPPTGKSLNHSAAKKTQVKRALYGGFILSSSEALNWANRLLAKDGKEPIKIGIWDEGILLLTLDERVQRASEETVKVNFYGERREDRGNSYGFYIVITQFEVKFVDRVNGKDVITPESKLVPGEEEEITKEFLKYEGVTHSEYETIFA